MPVSVINTLLSRKPLPCSPCGEGLLLRSFFFFTDTGTTGESALPSRLSGRRGGVHPRWTLRSQRSHDFLAPR